MSSKLHGWLATARIANVPSVISNVWLGIALGAWLEDEVPQQQLFIHGGVLALSGVMLYIGGNFFNDWHDRDWDETHRPERALPSGLFPAQSYLLQAIRFMGLGVVVAAMISVPCMLVALAICALILIYTRWHKKAVWPVIPMGLCRALLPVMGFLAVLSTGHHRAAWLMTTTATGRTILNPAAFDTARAVGLISLHAAGLFCWIVGLSLTARYESIPNPPPGPKSIARALLFLPVMAMSAWWMRWFPLLTLLGMIPFFAWMLPLLMRRHSVPVLISGLLAGIPLVECIASFPIALSQVETGSNLWRQPIQATTLILPVLAFMLGRRLQKVASAT